MGMGMGMGLSIPQEVVYLYAVQQAVDAGSRRRGTCATKSPHSEVLRHRRKKPLAADRAAASDKFNPLPLTGRLQESQDRFALQCLAPGS